MDLSGLKGGLSWPQGKRFKVFVGIAAVLAVVALVIYVDFGGEDFAERLKSGTTEERLAVIDELAADGSEEAMRAIAQVSQDEDTRVAGRALLAVAGSRLENRREYVVRAAKDDRAEVRRAAMVGIGRLKEKDKDARARDAKMLAEVVRDRDRTEKPQVRAAAVEAIGRLRAWDQRHAAIDALNDPSPLVRGRAAAALRRMTRRDFKFRADDPPEKRAIAVRQIRDLLR